MKRIVSVLAILLMAAAMVFARGQQAAPAAGAAQRISVEVFDRGSDGGRSLAYNNAWTQWIQEKVLRDLNIEVTFVPVGRWSETTDIVNLMASGSAPDLCYTYNSGMIASFRDQGGITNLTPYIESHLPDMKRLLGSDPALPGQDFIYRQRETATGRQFSVQSYVTRLSQRNVFIRKDWLDRLGLPLPRTTQEFYQALVAFRDRDPGNVGRNRVIPFGQDADARWGFMAIIYPFFDINLSDRDWFMYGFGDRGITMPGYRDGLRMMNQWYNEGLIYRDFPIMRVADDYHNMLKSGVVGAFAGNWDMPWRQDYKINEEMAQNVPGAEFVPVDAIQSSDGVTRKAISDKAGLYIFVPSFSRNAEAALSYLNWLCLPENFNFLQVGTRGVNHEIVNGVPRTLGLPAGHAWFQNSQNNIDYTLPMNGVELGSEELNARVLAFGYGNTPPEVIVNANEISIRNGRAPFIYQTPTPETQNPIYSQILADKADALIAQATIASVADFDRVWDAGMRDYLASGAQAIIDERSTLWPANSR